MCLLNLVFDIFSGYGYLPSTKTPLDLKSRLYFQYYRVGPPENMNACIMILMSLAVIRGIHTVSGLNLLIIHEFSVIVIMLCYCTKFTPLSSTVWNNEFKPILCRYAKLNLLVLIVSIERLFLGIWLRELGVHLDLYRATIKPASFRYHLSLLKPWQSTFHPGRPCPCIPAT